MSVNCEMFMGWTVKLIEGDVTNQVFDFFNNLEEVNPKIKLIVGRMFGESVGLIYVTKNEKVRGFSYEKLSNEQVPDDIYNELNECYKKIYNKDLEKDKVEYSLWYHWS